jgi:hypothetical protein
LQSSFNKSLVFLIKAAIEWKRGCNIALILHQKTVDQSSNYKKIFNKITRTSVARVEIFDGFEKKADFAVYIVYLL